MAQEVGMREKERQSRAPLWGEIEKGWRWDVTVKPWPLQGNWIGEWRRSINLIREKEGAKNSQKDSAEGFGWWWWIEERRPVRSQWRMIEKTTTMKKKKEEDFLRLLLFSPFLLRHFFLLRNSMNLIIWIGDDNELDGMGASRSGPISYPWSFDLIRFMAHCRSAHAELAHVPIRASWIWPDPLCFGPIYKNNWKILH